MQVAIKQTHCRVALSFAATCAQRRRLTLVMPPVEKPLFDAAVATARGQLDEEAAATA